MNMQRMDEMFYLLRDGFLLQEDLSSMGRLLLLEILEFRAGGWNLSDTAQKYYYSEVTDWCLHQSRERDIQQEDKEILADARLYFYSLKSHLLCELTVWVRSMVWWLFEFLQKEARWHTSANNPVVCNDLRELSQHSIGQTVGVYSIAVHLELMVEWSWTTFNLFSWKNNNL